MRCKAMPQRMGVHLFLDARSLGGIPACMPNYLRRDRLIVGMVAVAWKQPLAWLSPSRTPVLTQFLEQLWAKHHVPIFAPLATLDVNDHALAVDVRNLQVGQLGASHSRGVERHQQRAMKGSASCIDESRHFFLAEDRRNVLGSFRIGGLGCAPALLESLGIEEPQSRKIYRNGARRQLALLEQFCLIFANLLQAQTVWRTLEASREIFHYTDVTAYGSFSVIATLEFLQHHFSEMGHGDTSCDPPLHQTVEQPTPLPHAKRPPPGGCVPDPFEEVVLSRWRNDEFLWAIKGALSVPPLSFQYRRRPGCT